MGDKPKSRNMVRLENKYNRLEAKGERKAASGQRGVASGARAQGRGAAHMEKAKEAGSKLKFGKARFHKAVGNLETNMGDRTVWRSQDKIAKGEKISDKAGKVYKKIVRKQKRQG